MTENQKETNCERERERESRGRHLRLQALFSSLLSISVIGSEAIVNSEGYSVEVTGLSPNATEKDLYNFFAFSGNVEHVEIIRSGEYACTAYVTFKDAYSQETACLLSGATIVDQRVCITRWGRYGDEFDFWSGSSDRHEEEPGSSVPQRTQFVSDAGEAVAMAPEVVKTMLAKDYVLSKDALSMARDFDESNRVSATAAAKFSELSHRIGLADTFCAGVQAVKSVDEKYRFTEMTKSAALATGRTASVAANTVVNSSYCSRGALWVTDALNRASKAAADLGGRGVHQQ